MIYQIALIPGSLLTGFLLSPLLVLSRQIAQRPVRRLRFPHEKQAHRRALAAGFYLGATLIIGGLIGMWTRWCLRSRDPWLWVVYWLLEGRKRWTRPALLVYWALLGIISVAGWNRQLARSRRYRPRNAMGGMGEAQNGGGGTPASEPSRPPTPPSSASAMGMTFASVAMPQLPAFPHGANLGAALGASEWLDAADRRVPTLGLNGRRKFFHALAVVMFLPGVAADPAFAHLAFSAAFALFAFAEYVRYFALYPFGASVHLFMNEFLDHKDSGTAILSHFYLLTGCAGSVWFEGCVAVGRRQRTDDVTFIYLFIYYFFQIIATSAVYGYPSCRGRRCSGTVSFFARAVMDTGLMIRIVRRRRSWGNGWGGTGGRRRRQRRWRGAWRSRCRWLGLRGRWGCAGSRRTLA